MVDLNKLSSSDTDPQTKDAHQNTTVSACRPTTHGGSSGCVFVNIKNPTATSAPTHAGLFKKMTIKELYTPSLSRLDNDLFFSPQSKVTTVFYSQWISLDHLVRVGALISSAMWQKPL